MRPQYAALRLGVVALILLDTLRRMFCQSRAIDIVMLVIELLVLLLIASEIGYHVIHHCKTERRQKRVLAYLRRGQELQRGVGSKEIREWLGLANAWICETNNYLARCSSRASASFLHNSGGPGMRYQGVPEELQIPYRTLQARLNNLREIMEKPDVYL